MCNTVTSHNASATHVTNQDVSANQNKPMHSTYGAVMSRGNTFFWELSGLQTFLMNIKSSRLTKPTIAKFFTNHIPGHSFWCCGLLENCIMGCMGFLAVVQHVATRTNSMCRHTASPVLTTDPGLDKVDGQSSTCLHHKADE